MQLSEIRKRLQSVNSTYKLTKATELVATAKLQKYKTLTEVNAQYAQDLKGFVKAVLSVEIEGKETNPYLDRPVNHNPLHIIITSNSGLCGSYNDDILKFVWENIPKNEPIFAVGEIGINWLIKNEYTVVKKYTELDDIQPKIINKLIDDILVLYTKDEISTIDVVYTEYINTLTYMPKMEKVLPIKFDEEIESDDIYLEPSRDELLNELIPMYVSSQIYVIFLSSKTAENAARRNAMDIANKNAEELIDELKLQSNRARQAAITQQMNELSAASQK